MFPVTINFVKTHPFAVLPQYNHADPYTGDSGLDVTAVEDVILPCRGFTAARLPTNEERAKYIAEKTEVYGKDAAEKLAKELTISDRKSPWAVVPVGLKLAYITPGYWFRVEGRSGMGFKKHVFPHFGIIDNPYRGDMGIKLYNFSDVDVVIKKGDKIAQLIVYPLIQANVDWALDVTETKRGEKGFGSSDKLLPNEVMVDGKIAQL